MYFKTVVNKIPSFINTSFFSRYTFKTFSYFSRSLFKTFSCLSRRLFKTLRLLIKTSLQDAQITYQDVSSRRSLYLSRRLFKTLRSIIKTYVQDVQVRYQDVHSRRPSTYQDAQFSYQDAWCGFQDILSRRYTSYQDTLSRRLVLIKTYIYASWKGILKGYLEKKKDLQDTCSCFQDAYFFGLSRYLLFFSRRSFKTLVFWAVKTLVMFSRYLIKTFDLVFKTLFVYLENSPKRLENRSCFLEVSSFYFDYVLKGILIGYLDRVSWKPNLTSW